MDCYLCGAHNSVDADFCERCNGQLLKIGLEPAPEAEVVVAPEPEIVEEPQPEPEDQHVESLQSVEHRRLSAALGLGKPKAPTPPPQRERALDEPPTPSMSAGVAGVPTAGPSTGIPMIGTRAASVETTQIRDTDPGRKAAVGLIVLAALVGWFAYRAFTNTPVEVPPDELAFASTTVRPTTTTTEAVARPWTENEVLGKFSSVFVTVELHECPAFIEEETETEESLDSWTTPGVLIDQHNVVFDGSDIRGADIAVVRSRIGSETVGRVSSHGSGLGVITSAAASNRNLKLNENPEGDDSFWVTLDRETNSIVVSQEALPSDGEAVVLVSAQGDALDVDFGSSSADHTALLQISELETTIVASQARGTSLCASAPSFLDPVVAAPLLLEEED